MELIRRIGCIIWALLRLILVIFIAFLSSLHNIIFNQCEVISMTLILRPQSPERDKLSYIDKLYANNIEFVKGASIPRADEFDPNDPFTPHDMFGDDEEPPEHDFGDENPKNADN